MSKIISFFKWIAEGLGSMFQWIAGVPALVIASITGLYGSISQIMGALGSGGDMASEALTAFSGPIDSFASAINGAPDIVKLGIYCLSLDVLFDFVVSTFAGFLSLSVMVFTFFVLSVPAFIVQIYAIKLTAWFMCALFPNGFKITGLSALADINLRGSVSTALKDGKYSFFLGG